ncbi:BDN_1c_G0023520.mRNA.1.CDS.1 [Saccharomyces cerevisiae]|nr:BDN_1c_G0023520.mRNA.1.CDS.1 [Saccharomyces cerevisiae]CAI7113815.1 BDN_1c_G0023520.mRNA.1.CDS.1 [Saccharomyces cerevisiae]
MTGMESGENLENMEDILARHRKENKDLQNKITGMKKQATKSKRKEVNSKCLDLQDKLKTKQENEIRDWKIANNEVFDAEQEDEVTPEKLLEQLSISRDEKEQQNVPVQQQQQGQTKKRRNRQKERLAKRDAAIAKMKEEAALEASKQPDLKKMEQESIDQLCELKKLKQFDIQPDGHCLFASILDQLKLRHDPKKLDQGMDVMKLRWLSCNYVQEHRDDFIPYLFDEETMKMKDIDEYTKEMEHTAQWGGEIEILALSHVFDCPISILMSGRPIQVYNECGKNPELKLVYYKHSYALGEHYNSLHDS